MINIAQLVKTYRTEDYAAIALNKINLKVEDGEFVAITGPSGSGKTTLLNLIGLLDTPSAGKYWFLGEDVSEYNEKQRTLLRKGNISFVFQNFNLIDELTVFENIELPLLYTKISSSERKKMIHSAMEKLRITHRAKHFPKQLSGNQQQRVAISRAIVTNPKLILADEPTGNLDSTNSEEILNLLSEINNQGITIVLATHSPTVAERVHRIVQLFDGHIVTENIRQML